MSDDQAFAKPVLSSRYMTCPHTMRTVGEAIDFIGSDEGLKPAKHRLAWQLATSALYRAFPDAGPPADQAVIQAAEDALRAALKKEGWLGRTASNLLASGLGADRGGERRSPASGTGTEQEGV